MPSLFFDGFDNIYRVAAPGDYYLSFLAGNDTLIVSGGTDLQAAMGEGDDLVWLQAGAGHYTVFGESGADRFELWSGNGTADGGGGNDTFNIRGGSGFTLLGEDGNDRFNFHVNSSGVALYGGSGNDLFDGYNRTIGGSIYGGDGNDLFINFTGVGDLTLYGGPGNDLFRVNPASPASFVENPGEGRDSIQLSRGFSYTLPDNFENLAVGSYSGSTSGPATLTGNDLGNTIIGWGNDETFFGLGGDDKLTGKGGDDSLYGGAGNDILDGGTGNDVLDGGPGNDTLLGRAGDDVMTGGSGDDIYYVDSLNDIVIETAGGGTDSVRVTVDNYALGNDVENGQVWGSTGLALFGNDLANLLIGGSGDDILSGLAGNDTIKGGAGDDVLFGNTGDDLLIGNTGNDILLGGDGNDWLNGQDGNDILHGDFGSDTLIGGGGSDRFAYDAVSDSTAAAPDQIIDFTPSRTGTGDVIDLSAIDANTTVAGDQAFAYSGFSAAPFSLWATSVANGDGTYEFVWFADIDGDSIPDFELHVHQIGVVAINSDIVL